MAANRTYRATALVDSNVFEAEVLPAEIFFTSDGSGGTRNYEELDNKPRINGVELVGNRTLEELGIVVNPSGGGESGGSGEQDPENVDGYDIATDEDIDALFG